MGLLISFGIFLASYGEAAFNFIGFSLVIGSELTAALRWIATQIILDKSDLDAISTILYMSPASTSSLVPMIAMRESKELGVLFGGSELGRYSLLVLLPGFLSFLLLLVEVQLVKVTSSLTLSVFGNLKSVVTILFAIVVFGEEASLIQWFGLSIALAGMFAFSYIKKR